MQSKKDPKEAWNKGLSDESGPSVGMGQGSNATPDAPPGRMRDGGGPQNVRSESGHAGNDRGKQNKDDEYKVDDESVESDVRTNDPDGK